MHRIRSHPCLFLISIWSTCCLREAEIAAFSISSNNKMATFNNQHQHHHHPNDCNFSITVELAVIDQDNHAEDDETETTTTIANIINQAYRIGETGILMDTPEAPLQRATVAEVRDMIKRRQLLVLKASANNNNNNNINNNHAATTTKTTILGCIKLDVLEGGSIGEWGCLAVATDHQGKGYGTVLVEAMESYMKQSHHCSVAQLELLAPSNWKHEHKERLRRWYHRMGYELLVKGDYTASTQTLREGSILGERFLLATQADFTTYQKKLG
jgi:N-acetylglutamate synthase-like GNAT family acetyltransferase